MEHAKTWTSPDLNSEVIPNPRLGHVFASSCRTRLRLVKGGNLSQQPPPHAMGETQQVIEGPVEVVGQESDLLPEAIGPDRHNSPGAPPATSTVKSLLQEGQVTSTSVCPSVLIRRYRSCRKARSVAHSPPMT